MTYFLEQPALFERMGWVLLNSLWQLALIGIVSRLVLILCARISSRIRYLFLCTMLILSLVGPVATWVVLSLNSATARDQAAPALSVATSNLLPSPAFSSPTAAHLPITLMGWREKVTAFLSSDVSHFSIPKWLLQGLSYTWLGGVLIYGFRLILSGYEIRHLAKYGKPVRGKLWLSKLDDLSAKFGIRRAVQILQSSEIDVPLTFGSFWPVIVLPVSALTGLSIEQIETLIAHELAHIRRHDYFVNLIQVGLRTIFFYHPTIHWLNSRINQEREWACDDLVLQLKFDRCTYASALAMIEESRLTTDLALGASGGDLLARIRRIAGMKPIFHHRYGFPVFGLMVAFITLGLFNNITSASGQVTNKTKETGNSSTITVQGRVLSKETGKPIAGICIVWDSNVNYHWNPKPYFQREVTTDANGYYTITDSWDKNTPDLNSKGVNLDCYFQAPGYIRYFQKLAAASPGQTITHDFLLPTKPRFGGLVTDKSGHPIPHVEVKYDGDRSRSTTDDKGHFEFYQSADEIPSKDARGITYPVQQDIVLTHPDFVAKTKLGMEEQVMSAINHGHDLSFQMDSGISVEGSVVKPDGTPAANMTVVAAYANPYNPLDNPWTRSSLSDAQGHFKIEHLPAGQACTLVVNDPLTTHLYVFATVDGKETSGARLVLKPIPLEDSLKTFKLWGVTLTPYSEQSCAIYDHIPLYAGGFMVVNDVNRDMGYGPWKYHTFHQGDLFIRYVGKTKQKAIVNTSSLVDLLHEKFKVGEEPDLFSISSDRSCPSSLIGQYNGLSTYSCQLDSEGKLLLTSSETQELQQLATQ